MTRVVVFTISLILVLGGIYFYDRLHIPKGQTEKKASIKEVISQKEEGDEASSNTDSQFPLFGFLRSKSLPEENKPENEEPEDTENSKQKNTTDKELRTKETEPPTNQELKNEIREYLISSSNIDFPQNQIQLQLALAEAEEENPTDLMKIRDEFKAKLELFKKLTPPKELFEIHNQSIKVIQDFINLLEDTIHETKGSAKETWNSQDRLNIIQESEGVKQKIIAIVAEYGIELPPDVLPR